MFKAITQREFRVQGFRNFLTLLTVFLILLAPTYLSIDFALEGLINYPITRLLALGLIIILLGFIITSLLPLIRRFITRFVFKGSFDYEENIQKLAKQIEQRPDFSQLINTCKTQLKEIINIKEVDFLDEATDSEASELTPQPGNIARALQLAQLALELPSSKYGRAWFVFGAKINGDPWTKKDRQLLKWFIAHTSIYLELARERRLESLRLEQIKQKVAASAAELKQLNKELKERDQDLALQFDELAHDLKNPIAVMFNALQEVKTNSGASSEKIKAEVAWMNKGTDHLLDLARAEAGKIVPDKRPVALYEVLADAIEYLQPFAEEQGRTIDLTKNLSDLTDVNILADEKLIFEMSRLLITRAVRLTKDRIDIDLHTDVTGRQANLDIIIRPEKPLQRSTQQDLLDQFSRTWSPHEDRQYGITGLELPLARWILKAHQGRLLITESDQTRIVLRAQLPLAMGKYSP